MGTICTYHAHEGPFCTPSKHASLAWLVLQRLHAIACGCHLRINCQCKRHVAEILRETLQCNAYMAYSAANGGQPLLSHILQDLYAADRALTRLLRVHVHTRSCQVSGPDIGPTA